LPSKDEYGKLDDFVSGANTAGKFLKAKSGWNKNGNGEDKFGFSALPGGIGSPLVSSFSGVGTIGSWWSATSVDANNYYYLSMSYNKEDFSIYDLGSIYVSFSVRCLQD